MRPHLALALALSIAPTGCTTDDEQLSEGSDPLTIVGTPTIERTVKSVVDEVIGLQTTSTGTRRYAGVSVMVIRRGVRHYLHYGEAVVGEGIRPNASTLFAIGSITKTFTATLLGLYDYRRTVDIEDKLSEHALGITLPYPRTRITLAHLASHRSGLVRNPEHGPFETGNYFGDMGELMYSLEDCTTANPCNEPIPLTTDDGAYSNYGFAVLAHVLATVGGRWWSVQTAFSTDLLNPLGMTRTNNKQNLTDASCVVGSCTYADYGDCTYDEDVCNGTFSANAAVGYGSDDVTRTSSEGSDDNVKAGSGLLWSTPKDMMTWLGYNMGLTDVAAPYALRAALATTQGTPSMGWGRTTTPEGHTMLYKSGDVTGFQSFMGWIEGGDVGVVVLANSNGYPSKSRGIEILDMLVN